MVKVGRAPPPVVQVSPGRSRSSSAISSGSKSLASRSPLAGRVEGRGVLGGDNEARPVAAGCMGPLAAGQGTTEAKGAGADRAGLIAAFSEALPTAGSAVQRRRPGQG